MEIKGKARRNMVNGYDIELEQESATLRDQFAIHCPISLTDFIQCKGWEYECGSLELQQYAELRYRYADAMLAVREGRSRG